MKNSVKFVIVLLSIFILCNNISYTTGPCATTNCLSGQKYPMYSCSGLDFVDCFTAEEISFFVEKKLFAVPKNLPICLEFDESKVPVPMVFDLKWQVIFDKTSAEKDLRTAVDKWNCICYDGDSETNCQCRIKVSFTGRKCENYYLASDVLAAANLVHTVRSGGCERNCDKTHIVINNSDVFVYRKETITSIDQPESFFVTEKYIKNAADVINNGGYPYSFIEVIMHEVGHLFAFGHWDESECDISEPEEIMNSHSSFAKDPSRELSDYDKCMFQAIYCGNTGIAETYKRPNIIITPNPSTKELNISFEITGGSKLVSIQLCDEKGKILKTLLTESIYSEGIHPYNTKLNLSAGAYFILTTINNKIYFDKIIIEK